MGQEVKEEKEVSLEAQIAEVEGIVKSLSDDKLSIDQSIELYTEGMKALAKANELLDQAEAKVKELTPDGEILELDGDE